MNEQFTVDLLELLKRTEEEISAARGALPSRALKLTTGLWLNLADVLVAETSLLLLTPLRAPDDWNEMKRLRSEVELRFGNFTEKEIEAMIQEIHACQERLRASWYLARRSVSSEAVGEIGLVRFELDGRRIGRLQDVDIVPRHQGSGLGNELIRAVIARAKREGLTDLCLKANAGSWQEQWYCRLGFKPVGQWMS